MQSNKHIHGFRIGMFDSGLGGLTVLSECARRFPDNAYFFIGDNANAPYGDRKREELRVLSNRLVRHLQKQSLDAMIVACNTISSLFIEDLQRDLSFPVIGMISSGADAAVDAWKQSAASPVIGVLATQATVESHVYQKTIQSLEPSLRVRELACPAFTVALESGDQTPREEFAMVNESLHSWKKNPPPVIVLGCTHFPYLQDALTLSLDKNVIWVNPAVRVADRLAEILETQAPHRPVQQGFLQLETTGFPERIASGIQRLSLDAVGIPTHISRVHLTE